MSILEQMAMAAERYRATTVTPKATTPQVVPATLAAVAAVGDPSDVTSWTPIDEFEVLVRASRSVARVSLHSGGVVSGQATGFVAAPGLLLTANHVLPVPQDAQSATATFRASPRTVTTLELRPNEAFYTNADLDYTVVAVDSAGVDDDLSWLPLHEGAAAVIGESLNLVGCDGSAGMSLAARRATFLDRLESFVHYSAERSPGATGSPVLSLGGELLAMHHSMVPRTNTRGEWLTRTGDVWQGGDDEPEFVAGEGVSGSAILHDLLGAAPRLGEALRGARLAH